MTEGTLRILRDLDRACSKRITPDVTCKAGCSGCCHQVVYATLAEADLIYSNAPGVVASLRGELEDATQRMVDERASNVSEFGRPCPLLDCKKGMCRVYEVRPAVCRGYFSLSDPEMCRPPVVRRVTLVNTDYEVTSAIVGLLQALVYPSLHAPLPVALLAVLHWHRGPHRFAAFLRRLGINRLQRGETCILRVDGACEPQPKCDMQVKERS